MKLVEQHIIKRTDPRFAVIDQAAFASKKLYNQVTYQMRQAFLHEGKYLPYAQIFHRVKHLECYQALPRKVSNSILILIDKKIRHYLKLYKEQPDPDQPVVERQIVDDFHNTWQILRRELIGGNS